MPPRSPHVDPHHACFRLRVGRSRIERYGVFAEEQIPSGKRVIEYTGEKISERESMRRAIRQLASGKAQRIYSVNLNRRWKLDASRRGSGAEFINHSCDPNLTVRKMRGKIFLYSLKKIRRGQELTADYGFCCSYPCHCGARNCRGTLCHHNSR
jgi:uncharacterized protein